jgi:hypothetical protein
VLGGALNNMICPTGSEVPGVPPKLRDLLKRSEGCSRPRLGFPQILNLSYYGGCYGSNQANQNSDCF